MKPAALLVALLGILAACSGNGPRASPNALQARPQPQSDTLAEVAAVANEEVAAGHTPGAVILVGQAGQVVFRQAFGNRTVDPAQPMTERTIFDLASLTKVIATVPAIMQLAQAGRLRLDDPVARYWPEFGQNGKDIITIRQLLTHLSGLRVGIDQRGWLGEAGAMAAIAADRPVVPAGSRFSYSDVDFIVLGELVHRVSGLELDVYAQRNLFDPLGMHDTGFNPDLALRARIAPTEVIAGELRWGQVQDPIAWRMGGVAGHAGLFSTADDLARFAEMIRGGGTLDGVRVLSAASVRAMISPASPASSPVIRGLGWDIHSPFSKDFSMFSGRSFGHTGYTGTSIWFDPAIDGYTIILTNRLLPDGRGEVRDLRSRVSQIVAEALAQTQPGLPRATPIRAIAGARRLLIRSGGEVGVKVGIDVLAAQNFMALAGLRVGLITNHTGVNAAGQRTVDVLARAPNLHLVALFSPEHGLSGTFDEKVGSSIDPSTGLAVYSLYGDAKRPTASMLAGIDALVFDIQDAGVRYYTYITTMAYAMEAAAASGIPLFVLDRPDPLNASTVQGPVMDSGLHSFAGYYPLPTRHGMTVGEIARYFNREAAIGADLRVIPMAGYRRTSWFDETGLAWVNPSPNLRSLTEATLYAGVGLVEGTNVSVGRGTPSPFEVLGAPWIDGAQLAAYLNARAIPGVRFRPTQFTPSSSAYQGRPCAGVQIELTDRDTLDAPELGVELIAALRELYGRAFQAEHTVGMIGSRNVLHQILSGNDPRAIAAAWEPSLAAFSRRRQAYLIYP